MRILSVALLIACLLNAGQAQRGTSKYYQWGKGPAFEKPLAGPGAKKLPMIRVEGNKFVNSRGDTVLFRGCAIADPDKLEQQGRWNRQLFEKVREIGATVVRIPVHPVPWRMRTPSNYLRLLDQAVEWCTDLGMYIDIDWHSIGNLGMELFQDPVYVTTRQETYEFWRTIAARYQGHNTVPFYELFNEPTTFNGRLGRMSWIEWKKINEDIIALVRAYDGEKIPLVAGLDWAYDLTPVQNDPIEAEGIAYVTHPYPHKRGKPYEPKWEENFGFAASRYPVVASEFGFSLGKEGMADNGEYGKAIIDYLEAKGISWIAWVFDPDWYPRMLASWDTYALTESGEFFRQAMQHNAVTKGK